MSCSRTLAALLFLALTGCDPAGGPDTTTILVKTEEGTVEVIRPVGCESEPGSPTDMTSEPAFWLAYGSYFRWSTSNGCPVRVDVISHIAGAAHCGWEDARLLTIGVPLGASIAEETLDSKARLRYMWNVNQVIPGFQQGRTLSVDEIPPGVVDTGYRQGETELWRDPNDASEILLVTGDDADVYELITVVGGGLCA